MSLIETVAACDERVWRSNRARRRQIRLLRRNAGTGWTSAEVSYWRDTAELGWGEGMIALSHDFRWPYMPMLNWKAIDRTRKLPSTGMLPAALVAKAIGSVMAVMLAEAHDDEALRIVNRLTDPGVFVQICARLLDDGATRTLDGGPGLGNPSEDKFERARDLVWEGTSQAIGSTASEDLDLTGNRSRYAPI